MRGPPTHRIKHPSRGAPSFSALSHATDRLARSYARALSRTLFRSLSPPSLSLHTARNRGHAVASGHAAADANARRDGYGTFANKVREQARVQAQAQCDREAKQKEKQKELKRKRADEDPGYDKKSANMAGAAGGAEGELCAQSIEADVRETDLHCLRQPHKSQLTRCRSVGMPC